VIAKESVSTMHIQMAFFAKDLHIPRYDQYRRLLIGASC
jgi:hypothetical protein